ncbi:MAG: isoaspartyl peptidase/L-asparaginase family protein [Burkholderiales bacterium]
MARARSALRKGARRAQALITLAVHGGAGTMPRREMSTSAAARYRRGLERALEAGHAVLNEGGAALDAVCAAVVELEDDPLFNAGRGACYNTDEQHELDASVMEGATRRAGAVAAVSRIRNPVLAARAVMEQSGHLLLVGRGAERFARSQGVKLAPRSYFASAARLAALRRGAVRHHGTVGAVALDANARLAAATSTGGYTGKLPGRVGDSPIIGAGTYADDLCAVSGTGLGEAFIRTVLAYDIAARLRYRKETLARASAAVLARVAEIGGDGGLIAVDRRGNIAMPFNSEGMYRACIDRSGRRTVAIY